MNNYNAAQIPIEQFIEKVLGLQPIKKDGRLTYYPNPLIQTNETETFLTNRKYNIYRCNATKTVGNLIELGCKLYNCSPSIFLAKLDQYNFDYDLPKITVYESEIEITKIKPITNPELIDYALSRKIQPEILKRFCSQVTYQANGINKLAIGFANISRGWELRSANFRAAIAPKTVSRFGWFNFSAFVFEGMFDFLSFHQLTKFKNEKMNCLVLNNHKLSEQALAKLNRCCNVYLFLNNDKRGDNLVKAIKKKANRNVIDCSYLYGKFKDINEYLVNTDQADYFEFPSVK